MKQKYEAFISYRRDSASVKAELLRQMLLAKGIADSQIFMDTHTLGSGDVKPQLAEAITQSKNFLLLITDGCCDQIKNGDLWIYEIETAQELSVNMIPIFWDEKKVFPEKLSFLSSHNAVSYVHEYSDAFLQKLFLYLEHTNSSRFRILLHHFSKDIIYLFFILLLLVSNLYWYSQKPHGNMMQKTQQTVNAPQPGNAYEFNY